ncbi:MAG: universal stress protein, partial [Aeromicrobium sp.]
PDHWSPHHKLRGGIVVTVDGATDARGPLTFAFEAADRRREELHVLHVVPPATSEADEEEHRLNIAEVLSGWADDFPSVKVFRSLVFGQTDEACIGATSLANLVVVGRPHGISLPFSLVRPVAVSVIKEANCPVAVIPPNYG